MKMKNKKAEMGVGTLIIFIALLLVAAVAAGVIIQSAISMQEKALLTGDQAKGQIATYVESVEIDGVDGSDADLELIEQILRLAPGADPIKLSQATVVIALHDTSATLHYRGVNNTLDLSTTGYMTYRREQITSLSNESVYTLTNNDLDDDGRPDNVTFNNKGQLVFILSSGVNVTITSINCSPNSTVTLSSTYTGDGTYVDSVIGAGTCANNTLLSGYITVVPENEGKGYFAVEYLQRGPNPVNGTLQTGDVIKLYIQPPRDIGENEKIRLTFIPKSGTPTYKEVITPEVMSTERVVLG